MKRQRRSIWPARIDAGWRPRRGQGRPRGMSQTLWHWLTPTRTDPWGRWPYNGWGGGKERNKSRGPRLHYHELSRWVGGIMQYDVNGPYWAYVNLPDGDNDELCFGRRRGAKRWVESHPRRVR